MDYTPLPHIPRRDGAFTQIQPFTYRDGETYLNELMRLRKYVESLAGFIDASQQELYDSVLEDINTAIDSVNDALSEQVEQVNTEISTLATYVNDSVQSIINNSIEVQDPVVAALVGDKETETGEAIDAAIIDKLTVINIVDYGAVCDGVTDDATAIHDAITASSPGGVVTAPSGARIASSGVTVNKSITIDFSSNTLIALGNRSVFSFHGQITTPVQATATSTTIYIDSTVGYNRGDIVKVFSDDVNVYGNAIAGAEPKLAEFSVVESVLPGQLIVSRPLENEYTTNVRLVKYVDTPVNVRVGDTDCSNELYNTGNASLYLFSGLKKPVANIKISRGYGAGVGFRACYKPNATVDVSNLPDDGRLGYGVLDVACAAGHYNIVADTVRHAFTDDVSRTDPGEVDSTRYGYTYDATVTGKASTTTDSAWDTHHGGRRNTFDNVQAFDVAGAAVSLRGIGHVVNNPRIVRCWNGVRTFIESGRPNETHGCIVVNPVMTDVSQPFDVSQLEAGSRSEKTTLTVIGGVCEYTSYAARIRDAHLVINDTTFICKSETMGNRHFDISGVSSLDATMTLNIESVTAGAVVGIIQVSSSDDVKMLIDVNLIMGDYTAETMTRIITAANSPAILTALINKPITDHNYLRGNLTDSSQRAVVKTLDGAVSTAFNSGIYSSNSQTTVSLRKAGDPIVTMLATITAGALTFQNINYGAFVGQVVRIVSHESTQTANFGDEGNIEAGNPLLEVGASAEFVWNGSKWVRVN